MNDNPLRSLPSVSSAIEQALQSPDFASFTRGDIVIAIREVIDSARNSIRRDQLPAPSLHALLEKASLLLANSPSHLCRVINATGIILNTGLGRAPLADAAIHAVMETAAYYCNLEFGLESGHRGDRLTGVKHLLCKITGAEAATVVNNNAAATVLTVKALAGGREVVVSRGELIEIGGSFRLPEIFEAGGAKLKEVGTTNRTRINDYAIAIGSDTAALMHVHPSNFRVVGFTETPPIQELATLAHDRGIWAIDDIGSGALVEEPDKPFGNEPTVQASLAAGCDVVLFSGDKLLGGPQCGIIVGRKELISRIERDPLMRALRVCKLTLAALEATLRLITQGGPGNPAIPIRRMLQTPVTELETRADSLANFLKLLGYDAKAVKSEAFLGGGTTPTMPLPSFAVTLAPPFTLGKLSLSEGEFARKLRLNKPSVVARVGAGQVILDLRTLKEADDASILDILRHFAAPD